MQTWGVEVFKKGGFQTITIFPLFLLTCVIDWQKFSCSCYSLLKKEQFCINVFLFWITSMNITRLQDHKSQLILNGQLLLFLKLFHPMGEKKVAEVRKLLLRLAPMQKVKSFILKLCTYVILFLDYILTVSVCHNK